MTHLEGAQGYDPRDDVSILIAKFDEMQAELIAMRHELTSRIVAVEMWKSAQSPRRR